MRAAVGTFLVRIGLGLRGGRRRSPAIYDPFHLPPLTRSETSALLDERARRDLGMSGEEFERRLAAGALPNSSTVRSLAILVGEPD
jgi:hypothetical protein